MKNYNIQKIDISHIEQLVLLEKETSSAPWSYNSFLEELSNIASKYFVAIDNKTNLILGYIGLHNISKEGYITNIAVFEKYRRLGIASDLLAYVINFSLKNQLIFLTLEVRKSNHNAIRLYEKFGFVLSGLRRYFYQNPDEDALIYTLKI